MPGDYHSDQAAADGLHAVVAFSYPTEADRLADTNRTPTSDTAGNALELAVGHLVAQADTGAVYLCTAVVPLTWQLVGEPRDVTVYVPFTGGVVQVTGAGLDVVDNGLEVRCTRSGVAAQTVVVSAVVALPDLARRLVEAVAYWHTTLAVDVGPTSQTIKLQLVDQAGSPTDLGSVDPDLETGGDDKSASFTPTGTPPVGTGEFVRLVASIALPNAGAAVGEFAFVGMRLKLRGA